MSVDGLNAILNKEEVIVTRHAHDFIERPKAVDDIYRMHLRTYVPMHSGANRDQQTVEGFTKKFIGHVTERRVPRGYITADFGYGKTSTGLFLWGQAEDAGQLVVPPFQLSTLSDFLTATAGWVHYRLGQTIPSLQERAAEIYREAVAQSVEDVAAKYDMTIEAAQRLIEDKPQVQELSTADLVRFFNAVTELSLEAGFNGLLVIADEVQQYLEPQIKAGKGDPIGPLFDLIADLGGLLVPFGLLLIIPQKEIGVINDQRGDLIDRMRNYVLDLKTIYDEGFPARLWQHLGKAFDFVEDAPHIMRDETLLSLAQIALRPDLANGPRTVINAFRRAVKLYIDGGMVSNLPYTPLTLVDDFISGDIAFDGEKRIQTVVTRALEHPFVKERPEFKEAVKFAGAFPTYGATADLQQNFGLQEAFTELRDRVYGQVVRHVGDPADPGITLVGLEQAQVEQNWLNAEILEFSRTFYENAANVKMRTLRGFQALLKNIVFKGGWQAKESYDVGAGYSAGISFEGAFASFKREFPSRLLHAYIVFDDERGQPVEGEFDVLLEFRLCRYLDFDEAARQNKVTSPSTDSTLNSAYLTLNLARRVIGGMNRAVEPLLTKVVAPERLTPLFLLAMHGYFESRLDLGRVDKAEQPFLTGNFMPALLDSAALMLLDKSVAGVLDAAGAKLIEILVFSILQARYGTEYRTLMAIATWRDSMRTYANIVKRLESPMQKQGILPVEGSRDQTMKLINLTATAFDTLASNFPDLIEIVADFKKARNGSVRFRLHPLESLILDWLSASSNVITANQQVLHRLSEGEILTQAKLRGYKAAEAEQIITLLSERELIYHDKHGFVVERQPITVTVEEVAAQIELLNARVNLVQQTFPEETGISSVIENAVALNQLIKQIESQRKQPDPKTLALMENRARNNLKLLDDILHSRLESVKSQTDRIIKRYNTLKVPNIENLSVVETDAPYFDNLKQASSILLEACLQSTSTVHGNQARVEEVAQQLVSGNYSQDTLPEIVSEVRTSEDWFDQLSANMASLSTLVAAYSSWARIASERKTLLEKIAQLGRDGDDVSTGLERLDSEMLAILTQDWQEGLLQGNTYERRFKSLSDSVDNIEKQANRKFQRLQEGFLNLLRSAQCPENDLWSPIIFSQADIQGVHEQLYNYASRAAIATVDHAEDAIQRLCSELRQKLASPDREHVAEQAHKLLSELAELTTRLPYPTANDPKTVRDFDGQLSGAFFWLISQVKSAWTEIQIYQKRVAEINEPTEELPLSLIENDFLAQLKNGSFTDLATIWEYLPYEPEQIWLTVRELWEKGLIHIAIRNSR